MGAGLVIVVTVAAGIISVDMANIAAAADGKTEIFSVYGDDTREMTYAGLGDCDFFYRFTFVSPTSCRVSIDREELSIHLCDRCFRSEINLRQQSFKLLIF